MFHNSSCQFFFQYELNQWVNTFRKQVSLSIFRFTVSQRIVFNYNSNRAQLIFVLPCVTQKSQPQSAVFWTDAVPVVAVVKIRGVNFCAVVTRLWLLNSSLIYDSVYYKMSLSLIIKPNTRGRRSTITWVETIESCVDIQVEKSHFAFLPRVVLYSFLYYKMVSNFLKNLWVELGTWVLQQENKSNNFWRYSDQILHKYIY